MDRKPIGEKKLSNAEKQTLSRRKNSAKRKLKDKLWKQKQCGKLYKNPEKHKEYLKI